MKGVDYVIHHAGQRSKAETGSLSASIEPLSLHLASVATIMTAAKLEAVERVVLAASSPHRGCSATGNQTLGERITEQYIATVAGMNELVCILLRYSEVFGSRQDTASADACIVTWWLECMLHESPCIVYGSPQRSRDLCHVDDIVKANLLAATATNVSSFQAYDIGSGHGTTQIELFTMLEHEILRRFPSLTIRAPISAPNRLWEPNYTEFDIGKSFAVLGYLPEVSLEQGIVKELDWYQQFMPTRETERHTH